MNIKAGLCREVPGVEAALAHGVPGGSPSCVPCCWTGSRPCLSPPRRGDSSPGLAVEAPGWCPPAPTCSLHVPTHPHPCSCATHLHPGAACACCLRPPTGACPCLLPPTLPACSWAPRRVSQSPRHVPIPGDTEAGGRDGELPSFRHVPAARDAQSGGTARARGGWGPREGGWGLGDGGWGPRGAERGAGCLTAHSSQLPALATGAKPDWF